MIKLEMGRRKQLHEVYPPTQLGFCSRLFLYIVALSGFALGLLSTVIAVESALLLGPVTLGFLPVAWLPIMVAIGILRRRIWGQHLTTGFLFCGAILAIFSPPAGSSAVAFLLTVAGLVLNRTAVNQHFAKASSERLSASTVNATSRCDRLGVLAVGITFLASFGAIWAGCFIVKENGLQIRDVMVGVVGLVVASFATVSARPLDVSDI